jgi:serine-type D-Ala-D-Ala carboxypeptidase (penicillin-binding protein 5/6)
VKTGYTNEAGACLIARAKNNDKDILMVMLNVNNRWPNAKLALNAVMR